MNKYKYVGKEGYIKTKVGLAIARGFERIVHGGRGAYVEIHNDDILLQNIQIPDDQLWRVGNDMAYYVESRSLCSNRVKFYFQQKLVDYADYKIGFWYVSPIDLQDFETDGIYQ